jgi:hypothetical protein
MGSPGQLPHPRPEKRRGKEKAEDKGRGTKDRGKGGGRERTGRSGSQGAIAHCLWIKFTAYLGQSAAQDRSGGQPG